MRNQPTLLYVDDNPDDLQLLQLAATETRAKFGLQMVNGYYEAVDYLQAQGKFSSAAKHPRPAMVPIDFNLGSYTGADLARWIRQQTAFRDIPLVVFTESKDLQDMAASYVAGADYYLAKGATFDDVLKTARALDECLRHQPPILESLREVATRPDVVQQALRNKLHLGIAEHRKLLAELRQKAAALDGASAEQKERKKAIPFDPKRRRPPKADQQDEPETSGGQ